MKKSLSNVTDLHTLDQKVKDLTFLNVNKSHQKSKSTSLFFTAEGHSVEKELRGSLFFLRLCL